MNEYSRQSSDLWRRLDLSKGNSGELARVVRLPERKDAPFWREERMRQTSQLAMFIRVVCRTRTKGACCRFPDIERFHRSGVASKENFS
ncbi:hypothetical protein MRX96_050894 [Rhipicephalus microplus]